MFNRNFLLPEVFCVGRGLVDRTGALLAERGLLSRNPLVLCGLQTSYAVAKRVQMSLGTSELLRIDSSEEKQVRVVREEFVRKECDSLLAVGGGRVLDIAKRYALLYNAPLLAFPTIVSNDGLISPVTVLKTESGLTESLPGMMPHAVLVDLDLIMQAPTIYLRGAAGDLVSNLSANWDWQLARRRGEVGGEVAAIMSLESALGVIRTRCRELSAEDFVRTIIHAQIMSGIAMGLAGSSRPCSGSEHLLCHAVDFLGFAGNVLHGIKVASASLFTMFLQGQPLSDVVDFLGEMKIPLLFGDLSEDIDRNFAAILSVARTMRPGRYTILDELDNDTIIRQYKRFCEIYKDPYVRNCERAPAELMV